MIKGAVLTFDHGLGIAVGQLGLANHGLNNCAIQNANGTNTAVTFGDLAIQTQPFADITVTADFGPDIRSRFVDNDLQF